MREIVTLQLGSQANFLATHFWNVQESYFTYDDSASPVDHDIHFQPGRAADGRTDTYTPRTLIYDFKKSFGTLRRVNQLYDLVGAQDAEMTALQTAAWRGNAQKIPAAETLQQHPYQAQLETEQGITDPSVLSTDSIRFWSDYNRLFYHPRSAKQVHEADRTMNDTGPSAHSFQHFENGADLFDGLDKDEDFLDRDLRQFVEQCDLLQGLQLFTSMDDGWSGFTARYMSRIKDEYPKTPMFVFGCNSEPSPGTTMATRGAQRVCQALSLQHIAPLASQIVPLLGDLAKTRLPPFVSRKTIDWSSKWHTSALSVAAVESVTLPTRLRSRDSDMHQMASVLDNFGNRKISNLSYAVGEAQEELSNCPTVHYLPERGNSTKFGQLQVYRGRTSDHSEDGISKTGDETLQRLSVKDLPFKPGDSYPDDIFDVRGFKTSGAAVRSYLTTESGIGDWIRSLEQSTRARVPLGDREDFSEDLSTMADAYNAADDDDFFD